LRDRPDRTALLARLRLPALVIVGEEDTVTPVDEARAMAAQIPGSELVELDDAGHLATRERPAAFDAALGAFLRATLLTS
jgi:3-oxoadipate enol-lactonase